MDTEALPQRFPRARRNRNPDGRPGKIAKGEGHDDQSAHINDVCTATNSANGTDAGQSQHFEYLDHTADVQLHAWGKTLEEALANTGLAMYNYMTPLSGMAVNPQVDRVFTAEGHDMQSLVFNFLDELLFIFSTEFFTCKELTITEFDRQNWKVKAQGRGDIFDRRKHEPGTEVKAITYSAMQINEDSNSSELYVIVDI